MDNRAFKGFPREFLFMLSENALLDSHSHYESVKQELKNVSTTPMRMLCSDLSEQLYEIDPRMNLVPSKMVSRIRRDTRFSKNKNMYRDNMWCMFMRDKNTFKYSACMWFEVAPGFRSSGVGIYRADPTFMQYYRKMIIEYPSEFKKAVRLLEKNNCFADVELYKKDKPGIEQVEKSLHKYYNAKSIYFIDYSTDLEPLFDGSIEDILSEKIKLYTPFYRFIIKICDAITAERQTDE